MVLAFILILISIGLLIGANAILRRQTSVSAVRLLMLLAIAVTPGILAGILLFARHVMAPPS